jgi:hypothetical protein
MKRRFEPEYGALEHQVELLLYIGRTVGQKGKAGFNVDLELKGNFTPPKGDQQPDFLAYRWLQDQGLIEVVRSEQDGNAEGFATFESVELTQRGQGLYQRVEGFYGTLLEGVRDIGKM